MADLLTQYLAVAAYEGLAFPVEAIDTTSGNASAVHKAYGRAGADIEPCGREPDAGDLTAVLVNGLKGWPDLFPGRFRDLLDKFRTTPLGILSHPTRGGLQAHIDSYQEVVDAGTRNGARLKIKWTEHDASASLLTTTDGALPSDAPTTATTQATAADAAMAAADPTKSYPAGVSGVTLAATLAAQLAVLDTSPPYATTLAAVATLRSTVAANAAALVFQKASANQATVALEALRATVEALAAYYLPAGATTPQTYTTPRAMSAAEVAAAVYGSAALASRVRQTNTFPDPLAIPAGTRITLLPAP